MHRKETRDGRPERRGSAGRRLLLAARAVLEDPPSEELLFQTRPGSTCYAVPRSYRGAGQPAQSTPCPFCHDRSTSLFDPRGEPRALTQAGSPAPHRRRGDKMKADKAEPGCAGEPHVAKRRGWFFASPAAPQPSLPPEAGTVTHGTECSPLPGLAGAGSTPTLPTPRGCCLGQSKAGHNPDPLSSSGARATWLQGEGTNIPSWGPPWLLFHCRVPHRPQRGTARPVLGSGVFPCGDSAQKCHSPPEDRLQGDVWREAPFAQRAAAHSHSGQAGRGFAIAP